MTVHNIVTPKIKPIDNSDDESYEYLLAVSSDSLYVLSPDRSRIVETIVKGKDNDGYLLSADCENDFLDAIIIIKRDILSGVNPLDWILNSL
jgi:hypothetical protein